MTRTKKEVDKLVKRSEDLQKLLSEFGLRLSGFDPGVIARGEDKLTYNFDAHVWGWLEPLLQELHRHRYDKEHELIDDISDTG
jgi:hypothetical protein